MDFDFPSALARPCATRDMDRTTPRTRRIEGAGQGFIAPPAEPSVLLPRMTSGGSPRESADAARLPRLGSRVACCAPPSTKCPRGPPISLAIPLMRCHLSSFRPLPAPTWPCLQSTPNPHSGVAGHGKAIPWLPLRDEGGIKASWNPPTPRQGASAFMNMSWKCLLVELPAFFAAHLPSTCPPHQNGGPHRSGVRARARGRI